MDENTRGLGVVLRFAGAFLPLIALLVLFLWVEGHQVGAGAADADGALSDVFRVVAYLWAWPYAMWDQQPFSFGTLVLLLLIFVIALLARRDWRGAVAVLVIVSLCSWLIAAIIGQAQGF